MNEYDRYGSDGRSLSPLSISSSSSVEEMPQSPVPLPMEFEQTLAPRSTTSERMHFDEIPIVEEPNLLLGFGPFIAAIDSCK